MNSDDDCLFKKERTILSTLLPNLAKTQWEDSSLETETRSFVAEAGVSMKQAAQSLRLALTGKRISPPIFEVMKVLGREETIERVIAFVEGDFFIVSIFDMMEELGREETIKRLTNFGKGELA